MIRCWPKSRLHVKISQVKIFLDQDLLRLKQQDSYRETTRQLNKNFKLKQTITWLFSLRTKQELFQRPIITLVYKPKSQTFQSVKVTALQTKVPLWRSSRSMTFCVDSNVEGKYLRKVRAEFESALCKPKGVNCSIVANSWSSEIYRKMRIRSLTFFASITLGFSVGSWNIFARKWHL